MISFKIYHKSYGKPYGELRFCYAQLYKLFFVGAVTIKMIFKRLFKNYGSSLVKVSKPCTLKNKGVKNINII